MKKRPTKKHRRTGVLSHRSHTAKLLPRSHTSYPLLAMALLIVGVLLATLTFQASADSYILTATVPGVPPSQAANIDNPLDGAVFDSQPIQVNGTCEAAAVIKIYRNSVFAGSVICTGGGTFSLQVGLVEGSNQLVARSFNLADIEGPASSLVSVTYTPPPPPTPPPSGSSGTGSSSSESPSVALPSGQSSSESGAPQMTVTTDEAFKSSLVGDEISWMLNLSGGTAPYAIQVDWGDGKTDMYSRPATGSFTISHVYKEGDGFRGVFPVKITIIDVKGVRTFIQMIAIIAQKDGNPLALPLSTGGTTKLPTSMLFSWQAYAIALVMVCAFWLGEQRAFEVFQRKLSRQQSHTTKNR